MKSSLKKKKEEEEEVKEVKEERKERKGVGEKKGSFYSDHLIKKNYIFWHYDVIQGRQ